MISLRAYRTFQALILAASGLGLLTLALDGHLPDYIHPRLIILTVTAALAMIILAQFVLRERPAAQDQPPLAQEDVESRSASGLWWTVLPLLVGLLVSEPRLPAGFAQSRDHPIPPGQIQQTGGFQPQGLDWLLVEHGNQSAANSFTPEFSTGELRPVRMLVPGHLSSWVQFQIWHGRPFPFNPHRLHPFASAVPLNYRYD